MRLPCAGGPTHDGLYARGDGSRQTPPLTPGRASKTQRASQPLGPRLLTGRRGRPKQYSRLQPPPRGWEIFDKQLSFMRKISIAYFFVFLSEKNIRAL